MIDLHKDVQEYYGEVLQKSVDLQTNACCTLVAPPKHIKEALAKVHDEVCESYYGCGLVAPKAVEGLRILDLGSGSGQDVYLLSQFVGENGTVVGVDMTPQQLEIARRYQQYHQEKFGYAQSNVTFLQGNIDSLETLNLEPNSFDVIVSNCVINLVQNKAKVLEDIYRLLKPGGEFYFSDVYSDRRIPQVLQQDKVLWGECLSGALYWNDFLNLAKKAGFQDPRSVKSSPITVDNEELENLVFPTQFFSVTYRLFKIDGLESDCEDYGQAVCYKGGIAHSENTFELDAHHLFEKGKIASVCGNTYKMLSDTRFASYFDFFGNWDTHYGIFEGCGVSMPFDSNTALVDESCC